MYTLLVTIHIKPERRDEFLNSMLGDARGSVMNEPGCLRFDVIQDEADANTIYLYEVYRDQAAFDAHSQAPHFLEWREKVKDWYSQPTTVQKGNTIYPPDEKWTKQS